MSTMFDKLRISPIELMAAIELKCACGNKEIVFSPQFDHVVLAAEPTRVDRFIKGVLWICILPKMLGIETDIPDLPLDSPVSAVIRQYSGVEADSLVAYEGTTVKVDETKIAVDNTARTLSLTSDNQRVGDQKATEAKFLANLCKAMDEDNQQWKAVHRRLQGTSHSHAVTSFYEHLEEIFYVNVYHKAASSTMNAVLDVAPFWAYWKHVGGVKMRIGCDQCDESS